jgi:hypothetical protein
MSILQCLESLGYCQIQEIATGAIISTIKFTKGFRVYASTDRVFV